MDKVDQFESQFRSAAKDVFHFQRPALQRVLVVTDLEGDAAAHFAAESQRFLPRNPGMEQRIVTAAELPDVGQLLELVERETPDLICTYRHLQSAAWQWPYSLGAFLDVLTQATPVPVLVLPHPSRGGEVPGGPDASVVMAITDHLSGDDRLVSHAVAFTRPGGTLHLTHVEDEMHFHRLLTVISKIPDIPTEQARESIQAQLLKEPTDYIRSCREKLAEQEPELRVEQEVLLGHYLTEYRRLVRDHQVELLVMNTKDEDQLAMHGMAYPLAVELRDIALLML